MSLLDELEATGSKSTEKLSDIAYYRNLLNKKVIKLPYAVSDMPHSEVDYNNHHLTYDEKIVEEMRLKSEYYPLLRKILIETNDTDSLFYKTDIDSSDFCASFNKAREIAAYGDYCLLKLWTGSINNELILFSNVYPSMLMTIQLCQTKLSIVEKFTDPKYVSKSHDSDNSIIMETLGQYSGGTIEICTQRFKEAIKTINTKLKQENFKTRIEQEDLFIIVYLHELAHAMLDSKCEIEVKQDTKKMYNLKYESSNNEDKNRKFSNASLAMEESLANMIMLKYIRNTDSDLFEKAMYFVRQQCGIYSFGYYQFCVDADWTKWRDYKINHPESDDYLKGWYDRCFFNKDINISLEDYSKEMFNNAFE